MNNYSEIKNGRLCAICYCSSITKLFKKSKTLINNNTRCQILNKVFNALSLKLFTPEMLEINRICVDCDGNLEFFVSFLEKCLQADQIINAEVKIETVSEEIDEEELKSIQYIAENTYKEMQTKTRRKSPLVPLEEFPDEKEIDHKDCSDEDFADDTSIDHDDQIKKYYQCKNGGKEFRATTKRVRQHSQHKKTIKCSVCEKQCSTITHLKQHQKMHISILKITCRLCRLKFSNKFTFLNHKKEYHKLDISEEDLEMSKCSTVEQAPSDSDASKDSQELLHAYYCNNCNESFKDLALLKKHIAQHHVNEAPVGKKRKRFICFCGLTFSRATLLHCHRTRAHKILNKVSAKMTCLKCKKLFSNAKALEYHNNIHLGIKPYLCSSCPAAYHSLNSLEIHEKVAHQGYQRRVKKTISHLCDSCGKEYTTKSGLARHMISHVQLPRAFNCTVPGCSKAFISNRHLQQHIAMHNSKKKFSCDVCNKGFKKMIACQKHKNAVHLNLRPFQCLTCGLAFKMKAHLEKHFRTHTGEKPFPCPSCPYLCAEKSNLAKHMRIHNRLTKEKDSKHVAVLDR